MNDIVRRSQSLDIMVARSCRNLPVSESTCCLSLQNFGIILFFHPKDEGRTFLNKVVNSYHIARRRSPEDSSLHTPIPLACLIHEQF
jgi:hypothetical protein